MSSSNLLGAPHKYMALAPLHAVGQDLERIRMYVYIKNIRLALKTRGLACQRAQLSAAGPADTRDLMSSAPKG